MSKKLAIALGALLLVLLLGTAAAGRIYLRQRSLPIYVEGELPPSQGYANNTLTLGNVSYVSGKAEFRLRPLDEPFNLAQAIGRTTGTGWRIYRPRGQAGGDYIYVTGEMMPQMVYRDGRLPPLELRDMAVREIRLARGQDPAGPRESRDVALIGEVMSSLLGQDRVLLRPNYDAGDKGHRLELFPEQTPGLAYMVDVLIDTAGQAYLSTDSELGQDTWIPAGELFTQWARQ